ncbi:MAG: DUF1512 family protein [Thermoproteota archaeon]
MSIPLFLGQDNTGIGYIINIVYMIMFIVLVFWGEKIQTTIRLRDIEYALERLRMMRDESVKFTKEKLKKYNKEEINRFMDNYLEFITVPPVDMDPAGVVWKLDHIVKTAENRVRDEIKQIIPELDDGQVLNIMNLFEASYALNYYYKVVRHYYILSKKTSSYILIIQLQAILPQVMMEAEAYLGALQAFSTGQPVGDGAGSLVAARLMRGGEIMEIEKDNVYTVKNINGRKVYMMKAKGPGGAVGTPGDALMKLSEKESFKTIFMVDAGLKLEGEKTGSVAEGVGAIIGGIGTEKYKIEEVATKKSIPLYGMIIKMSLKEAITPMTKDVLNGVEEAYQLLLKRIVEKSSEGDAVMVVGVGNTVGIAQ